MEAEQAHQQAEAHIASLPAEHQDYARAHWTWLAEGQRGNQPKPPAELSEEEATAHRAKFSEIYASVAWQHRGRLPGESTEDLR